MKKILITGGAGYIGNVLCRNFLKTGNYKVTVLDSFLFQQQNSLLDLISNDNFNIIKGDVRNFNLFKKLISEHDIVIPLAAIVGAPACEQDKLLSTEINLDQIKNLKKCLSKDQLVILPITNSGYGVGSDDMFFDEKSPLNPISHYGKLKVEAEKIMLDFENFISLRLATVFGISNRMRIDLLVNDFVYRATKDKYLLLFESHFKRNFIHIEDIASVMIFFIENFGNYKNNIFNVGLEDANLSKKDLCELIKKQISDFIYVENSFKKDPDQRNYIVSNKKLLATGWRPKKSVNIGIKELIKCYDYFEVNNNKNFV